MAKSRTSATAPPADFDPNEPLDPSQLMSPPGENADGDDEGPAALPARQPTVSELMQRREAEKPPAHVRPYSEPQPPTMGDNARTLLRQSAGSAAELQSLEIQAAAERAEGERQAAELTAERDALLTKINAEYAGKISTARQAGIETSRRAALMKSTRQQLLSQAPKWLRDQIVARIRAITQAWHQQTTELGTRLEEMTKFVNPPPQALLDGSIHAESYPRLHEAFGNFARKSHAPGSVWLPPGRGSDSCGRHSLDSVMTHLRKLHAEWSRSLPKMQEDLQTNMALKQAEFDRAEDEAVAAAIECI